MKETQKLKSFRSRRRHLLKRPCEDISTLRRLTPAKCVTWWQSPLQLAGFILGHWVTSPKFCSYRLSVKRKKNNNLELKHPQGNEPKQSGKFALCGEDKIALPIKPVILRKYTGPLVLWRQGGEHIFLPAYLSADCIPDAFSRLLLGITSSPLPYFLTLATL